MKMKGEEFKRNTQAVITLPSHVAKYSTLYVHVYLYAAIVQHIFLTTTISIVRGLLEKYPTVFFYANTWWIII
jgi:hypothetical protein